MLPPSTMVFSIPKHLLNWSTKRKHFFCVGWQITGRGREGMLRGELRAQEGFSLQTRSHNFPKPITSSGRQKQENFKRKYCVLRDLLTRTCIFLTGQYPAGGGSLSYARGGWALLSSLLCLKKIIKINMLYIVLRSIQKIFAFTFTCDVCLQIFVGKTPRLYLYIKLFSCPDRVRDIPYTCDLWDIWSEWWENMT